MSKKDDLVSRLRNYANPDPNQIIPVYVLCETLTEAANEIERLRLKCGERFVMRPAPSRRDD